MYKLFTDGGARGNPGPAAIGVFLFNDRDIIVDFFGKYLGEVSNNVAEYTALIEGLKLAKKNDIDEIECYLDSELVVKQLNGQYKVSHADMKKLHSKVQDSKKEFSSVSFNHVERAKNKFADKMVNTVLDNVIRST